MRDVFSHQGKWRRAIDFVKSQDEKARGLSDEEISKKFRDEIVARYDALAGLREELADRKPEKAPRKKAAKVAKSKKK